MALALSALEPAVKTASVLIARRVAVLADGPQGLQADRCLSC
jgi:hypothetical protein